MVLVTRQAPDFTAAAVLGNGEIVEKFNFKQHTNGKPTSNPMIQKGRTPTCYL